MVKNTKTLNADDCFAAPPESIWWNELRNLDSDAIEDESGGPCLTPDLGNNTINTANNYSFKVSSKLDKLIAMTIYLPVYEFEWQCLLCMPNKKKFIKFGKSSFTNLYRHLDRKHPTAYQRYIMEFEKEVAPEENERSFRLDSTKNDNNKTDLYYSSYVGEIGLNCEKDIDSDLNNSLNDNECLMDRTFVKSCTNFAKLLVDEEDAAFGLMLAAKLRKIDSGSRKAKVQENILRAFNDDYIANEEK